MADYAQTSLSTAPGGGQVTRKVEPFTPTPVEAFFVARVKERVNPNNQLATRWSLERTWYENILFNVGQQWLDYSPQTRRFTDLRAPRWFPKPVDNQIYPRTRRLVAQLLKRKPDARVRPNSNEASDREAARDGELLLGHLDDVVHEESIRARLAECVVLTGTVISKEWYDPNAGPQMSIPQMSTSMIPMQQDVASCGACGQDYPPEQSGAPCPACASDGAMDGPALEQQTRQQVGPDGQPSLTAQSSPVLGEDGQPVVDSFHLGEVRSEIVLPFEFYLDENADTLDGAQWCAQQSYRDLEWIDRAFPERGRFVGEETGTTITSFYRSALLQVVGTGGPAWATPSGGRILRGGCIVTEYEERPTPAFPGGLTIITANNVLLYAGPLRIKEEFSWSEFQYDIVTGRFWGGTPVEQGVPLQRTINSIRSQIIINRKTILNPWILTPDGAGLVPGNVALRPGAVVPYQWTGMGVAPQIVPGQALPAQIIEEWKMALDSMDRIFQTEDAEPPEGVKSGVGLAQIAESMELVHTPRMRRWENFIATRGRKRLLLAQAFYKEQRLVKTLGAGSVFGVRKLTGADLLGNTDVTVEAGSSLPRSRMAQIQLIMDALNNPVPLIDVNQPGVREKILEEVGLQSIEPDTGPDRRRALVENDMMDQGVLPQQEMPFRPDLASVGQYDDHEAHLREHMPEIKDPRFDQKSPQARQAFYEHVRQTRMAAMVQMQLELAGQQQAEAGAAPGGAPADAGQTPDGSQPPNLAPQQNAGQANSAAA